MRNNFHKSDLILINIETKELHPFIEIVHVRNGLSLSNI
jgi:hypothetical protein